jgi:hypothetical protein
MDMRFEAEVFQWRGPAPFYFVAVPPEQAADLEAVSRDVTYGWGMIPVRGRVGGTEFETSLWPRQGGYVVPLKDTVRAAESIEDGATITVALAVRPRGR